MVTVLTGGINGGKTTKMLSIYDGKRSGDGFVTRKVFGNGIFTGYELVRLSSMETRPFAFKAGHEPDNWPEGFRYGPFSFSREAIAFAEAIIDETIRSGTGPVYIDEVGPVELQGRGFCKAFKMALASRRDICVAIREACVEEVLKCFKIEDYEIMHI